MNKKWPFLNLSLNILCRFGSFRKKRLESNFWTSAFNGRFGTRLPLSTKLFCLLYLMWWVLIRFASDELGVKERERERERDSKTLRERIRERERAGQAMIACNQFKPLWTGSRWCCKINKDIKAAIVAVVVASAAFVVVAAAVNVVVAAIRIGQLLLCRTVTGRSWNWSWKMVDWWNSR